MEEIICYLKCFILKNSTLLISILNNIVIGLISGFLASYLYTKYTDRYKTTKIKISNVIGVNQDDEIGNVLMIKIKNLSIRPLYDIKCVLKSVRFVDSYNNIFEENFNIYNTYSISYIEGSKNLNRSTHLINFKMDKPFDSQDLSWLLEISYIDAFTGLPRFIRKNFSRTQIQTGEFGILGNMKFYQFGNPNRDLTKHFGRFLFQNEDHFLNN
ncbi:hypothetical protein [Leeuwenhoekiella sp. MAR_2009_132]|uniref:hypothetical protein n=1 Tax=Leeuwenhoekiella sp. MAR_2009_132 TaxID=1392489 RepID=UPI000491700F|nr:hypothetical protein [Leeuwenhoekiella sp. MAR_2009_132]